MQEGDLRFIIQNDDGDGDFLIPTLEIISSVSHLFLG